MRERCGLMSFAAHRRCTLACETLAAHAIVRQLHRASVASGDTALSNTVRTAAGGNDAYARGPVHRPARRDAGSGSADTNRSPSPVHPKPGGDLSLRQALGPHQDDLSLLPVPHRDRCGPHSVLQFVPRQCPV